MIISFILLLFNLPLPESLLTQYSKATEKNVAEVLGPGELKELRIAPQKEYYVFNSENNNKGVYVVLSSAKGRYENFDYMIILNKSLGIVDIKILKYRSEFGYEISNKGWLKQFYGKPGTKFEYRKNIDAVSGATFSALAITNDINFIIGELR